MSAADDEFDVTGALGELLKAADLVPRFSAPKSVVPPQFDLLYAVCIAGCAIKALGKWNEGNAGTISVNSTLLKFGQFLAVRPKLLRDYLEWKSHAKEGQQLDLQSWPLLPRGFLSDEVADAAVSYLIAGGQLTRSGKTITFDPARHSKLAKVLSAVDENMAFSSEREVLAQLALNKPTLTLLGAGS